ncbi:MAG: hypothetical protein ABSG27_00095 [Candidatus Acidiferrales bacterium]|jgi:hypothetical protein
MYPQWIVKKNPEWIRVVVYSAIGMAIVMGIITFAALSTAK